jgi:hypothetical protein
MPDYGKELSIYPLKKPAKIICENHPELCNAASQDFQAVLVQTDPYVKFPFMHISLVPIVLSLQSVVFARHLA